MTRIKDSMETKFVWRIEKPNVYVAKVICTCTVSGGEYVCGTADKHCISCRRIIPKQDDDIQTYVSTKPLTINKDNEIEIVFPDYPSKADKARELIVKYEKEHYCQCAEPIEQTSMFGEESMCLRCEKVIKKL